MTKPDNIARIIKFTNTRIHMTKAQRATLAKCLDYHHSEPDYDQLYKGQILHLKNKSVHELPPNERETIASIWQDTGKSQKQLLAMCLSDWAHRVSDLAQNPDQIKERRKELESYIVGDHGELNGTSPEPLLALALYLADDYLGTIPDEIMAGIQAYPIKDASQRQRSLRTLRCLFDNVFAFEFMPKFYSRLKEQKPTGLDFNDSDMKQAFIKNNHAFFIDRTFLGLGRDICPMYGQIARLVSDRNGPSPLLSLYRTVIDVIANPAKNEHPTCPVKHGEKEAIESLVPRG